MAGHQGMLKYSQTVVSRAELSPAEAPGPPRQGVLNTPQAHPTSKLRPGGTIQDMIFPDLSRHSQTPSTAQEMASDIYRDIDPGCFHHVSSKKIWPVQVDQEQMIWQMNCKTAGGLK